VADEARVVLVTGGGRGIGRAISLGLAEDGFDVAVNYRKDEEAAAKTVADVQALGRRAASFQASVDDYDQDVAMVEGVLSTFGHVDALVNNAGVPGRGGLVSDTDLGDFERVMGTIALGAFYLCKLVVPHLRERGRGDIVMVSSQSTVSFDPYGSPYNMAKSAQEALAYTLAQEEAANGIRVNIVGAGLSNTDMGRRLVKGAFGADDIHQLDGKFGLGRVNEPEDVAGVVRFLLSPAGAQVTGQRYALDGGGFKA